MTRNIGILFFDDVFLHPGGNGTRALMRDPEHLDWVRAQNAKTPLMTSVCSGALVYAAAGLRRRGSLQAVAIPAATTADCKHTRVTLPTQDGCIFDRR